MILKKPRIARARKSPPFTPFSIHTSCGILFKLRTLLKVVTRKSYAKLKSGFVTSIENDCGYSDSPPVPIKPTCANMAVYLMHTVLQNLQQHGL